MGDTALWYEIIQKCKDIDLNGKFSTEDVNYQLKASSDAKSNERSYLAELIRTEEPAWDNLTNTEHVRILRKYHELRKYSKELQLALTYKAWDHIEKWSSALETEFKRVKPELIDDVQEWSILSE